MRQTVRGQVRHIDKAGETDSQRTGETDSQRTGETDSQRTGV